MEPTGTERSRLSQRISSGLRLLLILLSRSFSKGSYSYSTDEKTYNTVSRHYNANDGTHIFHRNVVVRVGVQACRRIQVCLCVADLIPNPRPVALVIKECKEQALPTVWHNSISTQREACEELPVWGFLYMRASRLSDQGTMTHWGSSYFVVNFAFSCSLFTISFLVFSCLYLSFFLICSLCPSLVYLVHCHRPKCSLASHQTFCLKDLHPSWLHTTAVKFRHISMETITAQWLW